MKMQFSQSVRHTRQNSQTLQHALCVCAQCTLLPLEKFLTLFQDVELYTCIVFIITSEPACKLLFLHSFSFWIIPSIQADHSSDTHSDTNKQVLTLTWDAHLNLPSSTSDNQPGRELRIFCHKLPPFSQWPFSFICYFHLLIPLCSIPLTVFIFYTPFHIHFLLSLPLTFLV